jgi:hypothetical protein
MIGHYRSNRKTGTFEFESLQQLKYWINVLGITRTLRKSIILVPSCITVSEVSLLLESVVYIRKDQVRRM